MLITDCWIISSSFNVHPIYLDDSHNLSSRYGVIEFISRVLLFAIPHELQTIASVTFVASCRQRAHPIQLSDCFTRKCDNRRHIAARWRRIIIYAVIKIFRRQHKSPFLCLNARSYRNQKQNHCSWLSLPVCVSVSGMRACVETTQSTKILNCFFFFCFRVWGNRKRKHLI